MTQENKSQKKVDYKNLSNVKCKICGKPLKQNSANKGHTQCFVCFKLSQGKRFYFENGIEKDRLKIQQLNKVTYNEN